MAPGTLGHDNTIETVGNNTPSIQHNDDDMTEMAGANRRSNGGVQEEKLVKWQLPGHHDIVNAKRVLIQLLNDLVMTHTQDITLIDSKQREWSFRENDDEAKFRKDMEKMAVNLHPIKNKKLNKIVRWVSIVKIRSTTNIPDWKNNDFFYDAVQEAKAYLFPHPFGYDEWDIISIGFIKEIHTVHYPRDLLHEQILQLITTQEKQPPIFQLVSQRITASDKVATTKAFVLQCQKKDAEKMIYLMTHGPFRDPANQKFVPFRYKNSNPAVFVKCIRQQNETYFKTWIIKVEGITKPVMNHIGHDIMSIRGVMHVVPSKRNDETGEWKILVDHKNCHHIHGQLSKSWNDLMSKVPTQLFQEAPIEYPAPMISSRKVRDYQDEGSNDSYGSLLTTGTEVSIMTNDEEDLNNLPVDFQYKSYAEATSETATTMDDTQTSSPSASAYTEWLQEKQALANQIELQAQQLEQLQSDLEAKINRSKDLEDKLAQALEMGHTRDLKFEEMMQKFEILVNTQLQAKPLPSQQSSGDDNMQDIPATPERVTKDSDKPTSDRSKIVSSPPSKKQNNNASPHRNLYTLFRQPQGKPSTSKTPSTIKQHTSKKLHKATDAHQMETDDDNGRLPSPGANPGDTME